MNTQKETSLTKAADSRSVFIGDTVFTPMGSVAFNGLEKEGAVVSGPAEVFPGLYFTNPDGAQEIQPAAEAQTAPVASGVGMDVFRLMAESAVDQGFLTPEGFNRVMTALEVQR